nr:unnamed protein product [Digitaria exilis]
MASRLLLGRIQSAGRLSGGHGRLSQLSFSGGRPLPPPGDRWDHGPHLDRFSDPVVAHEDRKFIQFLDRMLDAIRNPQSLAQIQRGRLANGLKALDDDL